MVDAGCTHAIIEATSHGLALDRLADCEFDVAVLTNLTSDHLDFHGTLQAYRAAKLRLFEMLDDPTEKQTGPARSPRRPRSRREARLTRRARSRGEARLTRRARSVLQS